MPDIDKILNDIHRQEEDAPEPEDDDLEELEPVAPRRPIRKSRLQPGWDRDEDGDPSELDFN